MTDATIDKAIATLTADWDDFPEAEELRAFLSEQIAKAGENELELLTIAGATSRPRPLRLVVLATGFNEQLYRREWTELSLSSAGDILVIFRDKDGGDYATPMGTASALPESLMSNLPPIVAMAVLGNDQ